MKSNEEIRAIIKENEARYQQYFRDYSREVGDPLSEAVDRCEVVINKKRWYLPDAMFTDNLIKTLVVKGAFEAVSRVVYSNEDSKSVEIILKQFIKLRVKHDFEFWAFTCVKIQDKTTKQLIPFKLNKGQRKLLRTFEDQRLRGVPIRAIVVKARQWGGSTLTQIYMLWLQLYHYTNWHSAIISQFKPQAVNVRSMLKRTITHLPPMAGSFTFGAVTGDPTTRQITERGCLISVGSAEEPDSIRSFDVAMCHLTEVAFWAETVAKSGNDVVQSLFGGILDTEGTFICLESTAKGIGNFFHTKWLEAQSGESELKPVFVSWHEIEMYTRKIKNHSEFIQSMTDYNWWQWEKGATLEGIKWYNTHKQRKNFDDFRMKSEFPTCHTEAFQTTSARYFDYKYIEQARADCRTPIWTGDIRGNSLVGEASLRNIRLVEKSGYVEVLKIWTMPETDPKEKMLHQFVVVVDIGGKSYKSDHSVISVFDRSALIDPFGALERAAIWIGHIDHDILAWKAAQIAEFYNHALLVIESNTIETRDKKSSESIVYEGDHFYTVIDELGEVYDNLYARGNTPDKAIDNGMPTKFGWHMNKKTKYQAYDRYAAALREYEYIERSTEAVNEMDFLQIKSNGLIEAQLGKRDDIQDTTAIGVYVAFEEMPLPKIIEISDTSKSTLRQKKSVGVAGF